MKEEALETDYLRVSHSSILYEWGDLGQSTSFSEAQFLHLDGGTYMTQLCEGLSWHMQHAYQMPPTNRVSPRSVLADIVVTIKWSTQRRIFQVL